MSGGTGRGKRTMQRITRSWLYFLSNDPIVDRPLINHYITMKKINKSKAIQQNQLHSHRSNKRESLSWCPFNKIDADGQDSLTDLIWCGSIAAAAAARDGYGREKALVKKKTRKTKMAGTSSWTSGPWKPLRIISPRRISSGTEDSDPFTRYFHDFLNFLFSLYESRNWIDFRGIWIWFSVGIWLNEGLALCGGPRVTVSSWRKNDGIGLLDRLAVENNWYIEVKKSVTSIRMIFFFFFLTITIRTMIIVTITP